MVVPHLLELEVREPLDGGDEALRPQAASPEGPRGVLAGEEVVAAAGAVHGGTRADVVHAPLQREEQRRLKYSVRRSKIRSLKLR